MKVLSRLCFLLTLLMAALPSHSAQSVGWSFSQMPSDLDQADVYLHTVDVGNLVYNNFGHTALRVHDKTNGRDLIFNWGIFDFRDPLEFTFKFYRGILIYKLGIYPYRFALERYQEEGRKVWEDRLNLSNEQKRKLFERLIWNSQPANIDYAYQYFFDNCSTRIRDYVDEAIGGQIKKQNQFKYAPVTFRDTIQEAYSYTPGMDLFLDIGVNSRLDRLITIWERMFHPINLREVMQQQVVDGQPLLIDSKVLVDFPRPEAYPGLSFILVLLVFGVPLSLLGVAFFFRQHLGQLLPVVYRLFALVSLPLLGIGSLLGFLMPVTWIVSGHEDLHHNANMLLFWPTDAVLVLWAFALLIKGQGWPLSLTWLKRMRMYVLLHMLGTMLMPVLRSLGLIQQDVDRVIVWVLPPYMVILFLLWRIGTVDNKGQKA